MAAVRNSSIVLLIILACGQQALARTGPGLKLLQSSASSYAQAFSSDDTNAIYSILRSIHCSPGPALYCLNACPMLTRQQ
ncbi:hypothetical protein WJX73_004073 [Symbiochloris irregularis]|uniref:Uncharacterized protein n=1 Tax=Symbiochloris irregularis TaxID=706552 RepID=A0AAW1NRS0_9CHLO